MLQKIGVEDKSKSNHHHMRPSSSSSYYSSSKISSYPPPPPPPSYSSSSSSLLSSSTSSSPCAACKFLRRKCHPECVFAPYFPPDNPEKFVHVHRVFGASNVSKLLNDLPAFHREDAVNSLAYEAEMRLKDPVYGCVGVISVLQHQLRVVQEDLYRARAELSRYQSMHNYATSSSSSSLVVGGQFGNIVGATAAAAAAGGVYSYYQQQNISNSNNNHHSNVMVGVGVSDGSQFLKITGAGSGSGAGSGGGAEERHRVLGPS